MNEKADRISFPIPDPDSDCRRILFIAPPDQIGYLVSVVESYGHMTVPRTVDQTRGVVELLTPSDSVRDAIDLLAALGTEMEITVIRS